MVRNEMITKRQKSIIVGCVFSDGSLSAASTSTSACNYRFHITQSEKRIGFIKWLKKELQSLPGGVHVYTFTTTGNNGFCHNKVKTKARLTTKRNKYFTNLHKMFYINGKKTVTKENIQLIDGLVLAMMIAGDGSHSQKHGFYLLHTEGFSPVESILLGDYLKQKFGLDYTLNHRKRTKHRKGEFWCLKFNCYSSYKLRKIITKYLKDIKCLQYKVKKFLKPKVYFNYDFITKNFLENELIICKKTMVDICKEYNIPVRYKICKLARQYNIPVKVGRHTVV